MLLSNTYCEVIKKYPWLSEELSYKMSSNKKTKIIPKQRQQKSNHKFIHFLNVLNLHVNSVSCVSVVHSVKCEKAVILV